MATDRAALVALYNATGGANWTSNEALSEWHGVVTDGEGRVKRLYLGHLVAPVPYRGGAKLGLSRNGVKNYSNGPCVTFLE